MHRNVHEQSTANDRIDWILANPDMSEWLKTSLASARSG